MGECAIGYLDSRGLECLDEGVQRPLRMGSQMHAQDATATAFQYLEIAPCLCRNQCGEAERFAGDRHIRAFVGRQLQEHAGRGATLVELPGGVQEARAMPDGGGNSGGGADGARCCAR